MPRQAPVVFWIGIVLVIVEALAIFIAPQVVPDHLYLRVYLDAQARANTGSFYTVGSPALVFDPVCGWANRRDFEQGNWKVDEHGARTTRSIGIDRNSKHTRRIAFLGSSLINGGMNVSNLETISATVEDSVTESLNFGTMMYSIDQCLLQYRETVCLFKPDLVVVGLSGEPTEGLTSRYVPFRARSEVNMPFFKPRFVADDDRLSLLAVPAPEECRKVLDSNAVLDQLRLTDGYFDSFREFQRFQFTPLARITASYIARGRNLWRLFSPNTADDELLVRLMRELRGAIERDGARAVFLFLPSRNITAPGWRKVLPDRYGDLVSRLRSAGLEIIDGRAVFIAAGRPYGALYHADGRHLTPEGNRILGGALRNTLLGMD